MQFVPRVRSKGDLPSAAAGLKVLKTNKCPLPAGIVPSAAVSLVPTELGRFVRDAALQRMRGAGPTLCLTPKVKGVLRRLRLLLYRRAPPLLPGISPFLGGTLLRDIRPDVGGSVASSSRVLEDCLRRLSGAARVGAWSMLQLPCG